MQETPSPVQLAASLLAQEEVIAIPTETVYGLAGNLFSKKAVATIYELKKRPSSNPLIVHVPSLEAAKPLIKEIPDKLFQLANLYWPGPLTLLLEKSDLVPDTITAGSNRVAIRVPNHPVTLELLNTINFPLVAPSANPYTRISPTKASHVEAYFGKSLKYILDGGDCQIGLESTIVGMENNKPVIYRNGVLSKETLEKLIGPIEEYVQKKAFTPTPGLALRHYAPTTKMILCKREKITELYEEGTAVLVFSNAIPTIKEEYQYILSPIASLDEAAQQLYQVLHEIDHAGYKKILCEEFPEEGAGHAINDRLKRASWDNKIN